MRQSRWTPSIIPADEPTVYLVADDFGRAGSAWRETDMEAADLETVSRPDDGPVQATYQGGRLQHVGALVRRCVRGCRTRNSTSL